MFSRTNCDRKSQLSGILTEPLNPRELTDYDMGVMENEPLLRTLNEEYLNFMKSFKDAYEKYSFTNRFFR